MRLAAVLLASIALLTAGCSTPDDGDDDDMMPMGPGSYRMELSGMPSGPMAPGQMFNVSVRAMSGMSGMHAMTSDHIGAHYWNTTMMDPTAGLGNATTCMHTGGAMPGQHTAQCTAPMEPGTYHLRSHARMADDAGQMHHWWSDEQTFTVG